MLFLDHWHCSPTFRMSLEVRAKGPTFKKIIEQEPRRLWLKLSKTFILDFFLRTNIAEHKRSNYQKVGEYFMK